MSDEQQQLFDQGVEVETVREIIGGEKERPAPPFTMPVLDGYPVDWPGEGIFFDMDEDDYHRIPALSSSGIKKMAASPMIYWSQCQWLNPDYEEPEQQDHFDIGSAYHCRLLEGREAFANRYAVALDKADHPAALVTLDDIKGAFPEGVKPRGKSKAEVVEHLRSLDATIEIWDELKADHLAENEGKCMISARTYRQIEIGAAIIEKDPEISALLNGGHPEVSLFWICARSGVPKKARVDKLRIKMMVDLKTLAARREQSIENAIRMDIANNRYPVQPAHYCEGATAVRKLVRDQGAAVVHGDEEQTAFALKWASHVQPDQWAWLYVLKGAAPIARGLFFPRGGTTMMLAQDICTMQAKRLRRYAEEMSVEPWLDTAPLYDLADEDIPNWSVEI